jgi:hypothetical protein
MTWVTKMMKYKYKREALQTTVFSIIGFITCAIFLITTNLSQNRQKKIEELLPASLFIIFILGYYALSPMMYCEHCRYGYCEDNFYEFQRCLKKHFDFQNHKQLYKPVLQAIPQPEI